MQMYILYFHSFFLNVIEGFRAKIKVGYRYRKLTQEDPFCKRAANTVYLINKTNLQGNIKHSMYFSFVLKKPRKLNK
jgi:hypothetical protein